jgi:hypothetical protein
MKKYLIGLFSIFLMLQPIILAKLVGANLDCSGCVASSWFIFLMLECLTIFLLCIPYLLGSFILEKFNEK